MGVIVAAVLLLIDRGDNCKSLPEQLRRVVARWDCSLEGDCASGVSDLMDFFRGKKFRLTVHGALNSKFLECVEMAQLRPPFSSFPGMETCVAAYRAQKSALRLEDAGGGVGAGVGGGLGSMLEDVDVGATQARTHNASTHA